MTPPQPTPIELTLTLKISFISTKTFIEQIPSHYVEQLIKSEYLQEKWDMGNYSQKYASQNYLNEREQLKAYSLNYKKKLGGFSVKYKKALHKWGRVFPVRSLGLTSFAKKTRNTLIKDSYYDFDLKNAQPEILKSLCITNNIQCDIIQEYCNNREVIIADIITASNNTCSRNQVKSLMIRLSFFGGFDGWLEEEGIADFPEPVIVKKYRQQVSEIANVFIRQNPDMYKTITKVKKDKDEKNVIGAFLSTYLQEYELRIVENVLETLCRDTSICSTDIPNTFIATYEFDGLKLLKSKVDEYGGVDAVISLINKLNLDIGFGIDWEIKPMDKFYPIVFVELTVEQTVKETFEVSRTTFDSVREDFEKTHCKILNTSSFIKLYSNKIIYMNRTQLTTSYEHLFYEKVSVSKDDEKIVNCGFIKDWLTCPDMRCYQNVGIYPRPLKCASDIYNLWTPFEMELMETYEPKQTELNLILKHIKILCNNDEIVYDYFIKWIGQMIQYPAVKSICPVLISQEGAGKGTLMRLFEKMLGSDKVYETTKPSRDVWGDFNGRMANTFLVNLNELSKKETTDATNYIKGLITDPKITINNKGVCQYDINSYHRFIITTNNEEPINTNKDDRRKLIIRCSDELIGNKDYFDKINLYLDDPNVVKTCYEYFSNIEGLDKFLSIKLPTTEYQEDLVELSVNPIQKWMNDLVISCIGTEMENECITYKSSDLFTLFNAWIKTNGIQYDLNNIQFAVRLKRLSLTGLSIKRGKLGNYTVLNVEQFKNAYLL